MTDYAHRLNRDVDRTRTSARYDEALGKWVHDVVLLGPDGQPLLTVASPGQVAIATPLPAGTNKIGSVDVANLPEIQPVSGTVTAVQGAPGAQAWPVAVTGSNLTQPLISETMDFRGKTAGRTFDVPHVAQTKTDGSPPSPTDPSWTEISGTNYGQIAVQDGTTYNVSSTGAGVTRYLLLHFDLLTDLKIAGRIPLSWTVDQLKAALKSLTVTWVGYGVGADGGTAKYGATARAWRIDTGAWNNGDTSSSSSPTVRTVINSTQPHLYLDNGFIHILAHSTYPSDGTLPSTVYTDYVKVDVQLYGETILTTDPLTYSPEHKATRTVAVNRNKTVVDTVVNAASVAAGQYRQFDLGITDESELWLLINIDKQPWTLSADLVITGLANDSVYPTHVDDTVAFALAANPATVLYLGSRPSVAWGLPLVTTIKEAKELIMYQSGKTARVTNKSAETATLTVRIVRVWR